MRLILSSTSFLLPKNKFWNLLEKDFQIEFADYGNWSGSLINTDANDALSTILFLDDVLDLKNNSENKCPTYRLTSNGKIGANSFLNTLKQLNLLNNKHIPEALTPALHQELVRLRSWDREPFESPRYLCQIVV
jgi:hypothetical protein